MQIVDNAFLAITGLLSEVKVKFIMNNSVNSIIKVYISK